MIDRQVWYQMLQLRLEILGWGRLEVGWLEHSGSWKKKTRVYIRSGPNTDGCEFSSFAPDLAQSDGYGLFESAVTISESSQSDVSARLKSLSCFDLLLHF